MHIDVILGLLSGVRPRGAGNWTARCPAHGDKNPSLSVREGDKGLLLRCWAGCRLEDITGALGLAVKDLFFDQHADPATIREARRRRAAARRRREAVAHVDGLTADVLREAEALVNSAHGIDTSGWSDAQIDQAMYDLADAYAVLEGERSYEHV